MRAQKNKANSCFTWGEVANLVLVVLFGWNIGLLILGGLYLAEKKGDRELKKLVRKNPRLRAHALEMARSGQEPETLGEALVADLAKYA